MKRSLIFILATFFLSLYSSIVSSQNKIPFGDIAVADLRNKPYKPDPGADAIVLSDIGIASLNLANGKFYVELVRDVKIRIVNSNGFDYANIELPFSADDRLQEYRASTFNLRNGLKAETKIQKKNFILSSESSSRRVLRFTFPDVREGSVIEYSYRVLFRENAIYMLCPWAFQREIPVALSSLSVVYPEYFAYRYIISGSAALVKINSSQTDDYLDQKSLKINHKTWHVADMPAFGNEPYIKSENENLTRVDFELESVSFPGSYLQEIMPSYKNLTKKLLERDDFGDALKKTRFMNRKAIEITKGFNDELSKLKRIHEYVSSKILWNGVNDYTSSGSIRSVYNKEKGNSADINFILIGMLRAVNIKADPVILCTRSNGSINKYFAQIQKFNYVIAHVIIGENNYLVDATDPLRPFNILPFDCLNGAGWLVGDNSRFIDLRNKEINSSEEYVVLKANAFGEIDGELEFRYRGMTSFNNRKLIRLVGKEKFINLLKAASTEIQIKEINLKNLEFRDSVLAGSAKIFLKNGAQVAGNSIIFNPFLSLVAVTNPFYEETRKYPVDFGIPNDHITRISFMVPEGYSVQERPQDEEYLLGDNNGKYSIKCELKDNRLEIISFFRIDKIVFLPSEYSALKEFYAKILKKESELIVLKPSTLN